MIDLLGLAADVPAVSHRRPQPAQDARVEMGEPGALARLNHPHPLRLAGFQMHNGKPRGDHRLAVGVGPDQHQTASA
jgi:hypothetical protein